MTYDSHNVFARIIRSEIPCKKVYEDTYTLAFYDIHPQAPLHILVIPKKSYQNFSEFSSFGTPVEICSFFKAVGAIANQAGLEDTGYRLLMNQGQDAGQEVPHFHVHICGGGPLGPLLSNK